MGKGSSKFPLSGWEVAVGLAVVVSYGIGLLGVYFSMPPSDYSFLKLPRTLEELQTLRDHLEGYASDYTVQVLVGYCTVYIFMQTFMIPGTIFMSLLAGALFGVFRGVALVVFAATAGASSCYFLSKLIGRPLAFSLWPDKLIYFQAQTSSQSHPGTSRKPQAMFVMPNQGVPVKGGIISKVITVEIFECSILRIIPNKVFGVMHRDRNGMNVVFNMLIRKVRQSPGTMEHPISQNRSLIADPINLLKKVSKRREKLLNYMLFLRVTPTLPNTFINVASPIVDVPYHIFFLATFIGLIPAAYVTVKAGIALGELRSIGDLYDFQSIATLFFIGIVSVTPTLFSKNQMAECEANSKLMAN